MRTFEETEAHLLEVAKRIYQGPNERAAMRGALLDAAALCDAMARRIQDGNRVRGGRVSRIGQDLADIATKCGDAIQAMREKL